MSNEPPVITITHHIGDVELTATVTLDGPLVKDGDAPLLERIYYEFRDVHVTQKLKAKPIDNSA